MAGLEEADARQLPSGSAAKAKLQEKLAAHQEVGPVMCAPACPCGKPLPDCGAQQSLLLAIHMLIYISTFVELTGVSHLKGHYRPCHSIRYTLSLICA